MLSPSGELPRGPREKEQLLRNTKHKQPLDPWSKTAPFPPNTTTGDLKPAQAVNITFVWI